MRFTNFIIFPKDTKWVTYPNAILIPLRKPVSQPFVVD